MSEERIIQLTDKQLHGLVEEAVNDALIKLGVDPTDPIEMQKQFADLREWSRATRAIKTRGLLAVVSMLAAGVAAALWLGFKGLIQS